MNTPKGPSVLDQWEAKAKERIKQLNFQQSPTYMNRILALIDLVREKDKKLVKMRLCALILGEQNITRKIELMDKAAEEALALTEELK